MRENIYILKKALLRRKQNTLLVEYSNEGSQSVRRFFPIETIGNIYVFGETSLNTSLINFLSANGVLVHFFNYYGHYTATIYPKEANISGLLIIKQVEHYLDQQKRLFLAQKLVSGSIINILKILSYYENRNKDISNEIGIISELIKNITKTTEINEIRGIEGKARNTYFAAWGKIITNPYFSFKSRERRPPTDPINALISFGNSLLYAAIVGELYHVQLNGSISYVHEPGRFRFSLALDLADLFKPVLVDRLIFRIVNKKIIKPQHFNTKLGSILLTEEGKKIFLSAWDETLKRTIKHPTLRRSVSMRQLIRLECYKLIKHLLGEKEYEPFKMWWQ